MKRRSLLLIAGLLAAALAGASREARSQASALRVLASNGVKAVVETLQPDAERAIGRTLAIEFSTAASLAERIEADEPFDVAILTPALIAKLSEEGRIAAGSQIEFARAGVGVGARAGTGERDVGTPEALERTLLGAHSVAFTADGQSRITVDKAFAELGIAEAMREKTILMGPGQAPGAVAAGEAELVLTLISEILPVAGLELVGPLPPALQGYVRFTAGRGSAAGDTQGADALLAYLRGARFAAALAEHGMEAVR